jgi:two-component system chemotaxis response regulator CheB
MPKIRVMVVDDSALIRKLLTGLLTADPELEVVGTAPNGKIALTKISQINPDLITLDVEMPEMDGLETVTEIRKIYPKLPVIMCSTLTMSGGHSTLDALARGADDYVTKPSASLSQDELRDTFGSVLIAKIKALVAHRPLLEKIFEPKPGLTQAPRPIYRPSLTQEPINVVTIGTSTGGPNALTELIVDIPAEFPVPLLIVQHMPPLFTRLLAERLTQKGHIPVTEAVEGEEVFPGHAWVAPGNFHMTVVAQGDKKIIRLNQDPPENSCRPAVDVLFRSVAACYGKNTLAVVMTGMGYDGLRGSEHIREAGGRVLAQDEATSVVWGMPGAVATAGLADKILPLKQLGTEIVHRVKQSRLKGLAHD